MRIAFLTPEFLTELPDGGGLGNYLSRMGQFLSAEGHEAEIFVTSEREPRLLDYHGLRVERVPPVCTRLWANLLGHVARVPRIGQTFRAYSGWVAQAGALADAMERRHQDRPFDVVQSADYLAVGLCVRRLKGRTHVVRASSAADLYNEMDGTLTKVDRLRAWLERLSIRRADRAYAPSRFIAEHFRDRHGIPVAVVRPPLKLEAVQSAVECCWPLPERFMVHFGQLNQRKGTLWLGRALKIAFDEEPSLRMLWIGRGHFDQLSPLLTDLGQHRSKVQVLYPLPKQELYAIVRLAEAAVLPSLVDNLPNTVLESLMLGIPVIGTRGASIDEIVEDGRTGELVAPGDVPGLASAMVRVWRGQSLAKKGFSWGGMISNDMEAKAAIESFLQLAGYERPKEDQTVQPSLNCLEEAAHVINQR